MVWNSFGENLPIHRLLELARNFELSQGNDIAQKTKEIEDKVCNLKLRSELLQRRIERNEKRWCLLFEKCKERGLLKGMNDFNVGFDEDDVLSTICSIEQKVNSIHRQLKDLKEDCNRMEQKELSQIVNTLLTKVKMQKCSIGYLIILSSIND